MNASVASNELLRRDDFHPEIAGCGEFDGGLAALIDETNWSILTKRLLAYARYRLSRHGSFASRYTNRAEDYVQEAAIRLMEGTRQFEEGTRQNLFHFLCGVIDSLVSHDAEKAGRLHLQTLVCGEYTSSPNEIEEEHLSSDEDFEDRIIARNELERFMASLEPDLQEYVRLRAAGNLKTAEDFATTLRTTVSDIRNRDRRLRRRRNQW